jgi:tetratricopeptide (TPR) repeat protein/O-antigen ligase
MATKLSVLCDRIIEAGWLVALIVTPLFFNVYSSRVFEPDKLIALHCIALVMTLAWIIKGIDAWLVSVRPPAQHVVEAPGASEGGRHWYDRLATNPLPALALCFLAVYAGATVTSIVPRLSFWGAYDRLQGLYITSAYLVVFFAIVTLLRTHEQVERLCTTALIVSLPVSLYGIIQHFGTDPVPWSGDVTQRVASTMGNPIFVAAFLIMVVPLTLYRHLQAGQHIVEHESRGTQTVLIVGSLAYLGLQVIAWWIGPTTGTLAAVTTMGIWTVEAVLLGKPVLPFIRIGSYSMLLSTQLACILLSQSRGPWLGLGAGLGFFALLWTMVYGKWRWATVITVGSVAVILILVLLNLPASPLAFVRQLPYLGRLGRVFDATGQVRLLIWQGAIQLITADPWRAIIGYGPETMYVAYPPYYPPELGQVEQRTALPDRAHNETIDVLVSTGLLGFVVYVVFFTTLFVQGLRTLGLIHSPPQRYFFLGLWSLGGIGAVLLARLLEHSWRLFGVTLPLGMLAGMFVYLGVYGVRRLCRGEALHLSAVESSQRLLGSTFLAALVAYLVEIQFGIAIAATRTYFWAYVALVVVAGQLQHGNILESSTVSPASTRSRRQQPQPAQQHAFEPGGVSRQLMVGSLLVSGVMVTMVYDFLSFRISQANLPSIIWLFAYTWLLSGVIVLTEAWAAAGVLHPGWRRLRDYGLYTGGTLAGPLLFAAIHLRLLRLVAEATDMPIPYYIAIFVVLVTTGVALLIGVRLPALGLSRMTGVMAGGLVLGGLMLVSTINLNVVRADISYKQAVFSVQQRQYERAIALLRQALALQPQQDFYYLFLGKTWLEKALHTTPGPGRQALFQEAEAALTRARDLHPLNPDHMANLARLHRLWAQHSDDPTQQTGHLQTAAAFYAQATTRNPNNVLLWNEWGTTYATLGDETQARAKYERALALDATYVPTYLHLGDLARAQGQWHEAVQAYEQAVQRDQNSIPGHSALGLVYANMGRLADAVRANQRVVALAPADVAAHRNLAVLFHAMGQIPQALAHAHRALEVAPPQERAALEKLIAQWRQ